MGWVRTVMNGGGIAALVTIALLASPAFAQQTEEAALDRLIDATASNDGALALAREQAGGGDLTGAAATLERALLGRAGAASDPVRLYYAAILCRLDDRRRAGYQLGNVTAADAPGWGEARQACGDVAVPAPTRGNGIAGEVSIGLAYDGDSFGALATQLDLPTVPRLRDDGLSIITTGRLLARFAGDATSYGYADVALLAKDSVSGPRLDYQVGSARVGYTTQVGGNADLSLGGVLRHARLFADPFFTEYGGQVTLGVATTSTARVALDVEAVHQRYHGSIVAAVRDGMRYDLAASYQSSPASGTSFVAGLAFEAKDADTRSLAYRGGRAFAGVRLPIGESGFYTALSATVRHVDYRIAPTSADVKEWRLFARAAVGVPLGPKGLFAEVAASYTARLYNSGSGLRDYDSVGTELRLVYHFGN